MWVEHSWVYICRRSMSLVGESTLSHVSDSKHPLLLSVTVSKVKGQRSQAQSVSLSVVEMPATQYRRDGTRVQLYVMYVTGSTQLTTEL